MSDEPTNPGLRLVKPNGEPIRGRAMHAPNLDADLAQYMRAFVVGVYGKVMEIMAQRVRSGFRGIGWVGCEVVNRNGYLEPRWPLEFTKPHQAPEHIRPFVSYPLTDEVAETLKRRAERTEQDAATEELQAKLAETPPEGTA